MGVVSIDLVVPGAAEIDALEGGELDRALWELELADRRLQAAKAQLVAKVDRSLHFTWDGHRSVKGWVMAVTNCSPATALRLARVGRVLDSWPELTELFVDAGIGVDQVAELGRIGANPRCGALLPEAGAPLLEAGRELEFVDFRTVAQRWEQLADADGAHRQHEASRARRDVTISEVGGEFVIKGRLPVIEGTAVRDILQRFADAEFHTDADAARAEHGQATKHNLARTAAQRRADGFVNMCATAAGAGVAGTPIEVCVNVVITQDQYEQQLTNMIDGTPVTIDPATVREQRCETSDGIPVDPEQAVALSIVGQVRRVVLNSNSIIIDAGQRVRLFRGELRNVLKAMSPRCSWLGCTIRAAISQLDHNINHTDGGPTSAANAKIGCQHHNIFKYTNNYVPHQDPDGNWHLHRPDGTRMQPPDAA